jgi:hypothetical protein
MKLPREIEKDDFWYKTMMYRLKRENMWDEHMPGSLTLFGRRQTAKLALIYITQLESRLAQVERERDAAVADLMTASMNLCSACKYDSWPECGKTGRLNLDADDAVACKHFEWRGAFARKTRRRAPNAQPATEQ